MAETKTFSVTWHGEQVEMRYGEMLQKLAAIQQPLTLNFIEFTSGNDERYFEVQNEEDLQEYLEMPQVIRRLVKSIADNGEALAAAVEQHIAAGHAEIC